VGDEQANRATEVELFMKLAELKKERVAENVNLSRILCQQVLEEVWNNDEKQILDSEFTTTVASATVEYYKKAAGPCKEELCRAFFEKNFWHTVVILLRKRRNSVFSVLSSKQSKRI